jgi:hypothetical protein
MEMNLIKAKQGFIGATEQSHPGSNDYITSALEIALLYWMSRKLDLIGSLLDDRLITLRSFLPNTKMLDSKRVPTSDEMRQIPKLDANEEIRFKTEVLAIRVETDLLPQLSEVVVCLKNLLTHSITFLIVMYREDHITFHQQKTILTAQVIFSRIF